MHFISLEKDYTDFLREIGQKDSAYVVVDTEFVRQKTFYPEPSLIQIVIDKECFILDVLSTFWDTRHLSDLFYMRSKPLVLHSCRQDLEIFFHLFKKLPENIFDTQIAALFLGLRENLAYHALVKNYLDITLDKSQQYTHWLNRPLSKEQLLYAAADVIHLYDIYPKILDELQRVGRLHWCLDEMKALSDPKALFEISTNRLGRLGISKTSYPFARSLMEFRDIHASQLNINRSRFLTDRSIADLCTIKEYPDFARFLQQTPLKEYGLVEASLNFFEMRLEMETTHEKKDMTPFEIKKLGELKEERDELACKLNLPRSFLANNEDLESFLRGGGGRIATTWRREAFNI